MPLDPSRIRALCFDIDGTICDTDDLYVTRFERILNPVRGLFPRRKVRPFVRWMVMGLETPGNLMYHFLDRHGLDSQIGRLYNFIARHQRNRPGNFLLTPGIHETLVALSAHYPMAVVSARDQRTTLAFLDTFGLRPLFQAVATSQTCTYTKPFPDPVVWAAHQMGVEPAECLMIGDTTVDINAGKAAGAQTVGVLCGFGLERELLRAGADLVLASTSDLSKVLLPTPAPAFDPAEDSPGILPNEGIPA